MGYVSSSVLTDKYKDLNDRFFLILNEIVKTYPSFNYNESNGPREDTQLYNQNMSQMMSLQNEYFLFKNNVVGAIETVQKDIKISDDKINVLEGKNKVLKIQLDSLKSSSYSAEGLFDDAQISRNELYVSNFILFSIICGGGYMYYRSVGQTVAPASA